MTQDISHRLEPASSDPGRPARKDRRWLWAALLGLIVVIMTILSGLALNYQSQFPGLVSYPNLEHGETRGPISYAQSPPAGGKYAPEWQNCGIYNVSVPNENAVHALAHGAVWITYRPDLAIGDIGAIERLVRNRTYVLVSPYPGQAAPIIATAWGAQLKLYDPKDNQLALFLVHYRQGPQAPEPGQPCTGGVGAP
jgi:hypothetical protein